MSEIDDLAAELDAEIEKNERAKTQAAHAVAPTPAASQPAVPGVSSSPELTHSDATVDESKGAPLGDRFKVSLLIRPEEKVAYLERKYGKSNVRVSAGGDLEYRPTDSMQWARFTPTKESLLDIAAGNAGAIIEAVPMMAIAATNPASLAVAGLGGMAGRGIRQLVSDATSVATGGAPTGSMGERSQDLAEADLGSVLAQGGANIAARGLRMLKPGAATIEKIRQEIVHQQPYEAPSWTRKLPEALGIRAGAQTAAKLGEAAADEITGHASLTNISPAAKQGRNLAREVPHLSVGEQTLSPTAIALEGTARRSPALGGMVAASDRAAQREFQAAAQELLDMTAPAATKEAAGDMLRSTYEDGLTKILEPRRAQAGAAIRQAIRDMGGAGATQAIPTKGLRRAASRLAGQLDNNLAPLGLKDTAIAGRLREFMAELPESISPRQAQQNLSALSSELGKTGNILRDIPSSQRRRVAGVLMDAAWSDIASAATRGNFSQAAVANLRVARAAYADAMRAIEAHEQSALGKLIGNDTAPEVIINRFKNWAPSQLRSVMATVRGINPDVADQVGRALLESEMTKATTTMAFGAKRLQPAAIAKLADGEMAALFSAVLPKQSQGALLRLAEIARRLRYRPMEGSPTALIQEGQQTLGLRGVGPMARRLAAAGALGAAGGQYGGSTGAGLGIAAGLAGDLAAQWWSKRSGQEITRMLFHPQGVKLILRSGKMGNWSPMVLRSLEEIGRGAYGMSTQTDIDMSDYHGQPGEPQRASAAGAQ